MTHMIHCFNCDRFGAAGQIHGIRFRFCECGNLAAFTIDLDAERAYDLKRKHDKKNFYRSQKEFRQYLWDLRCLQ